MNKCHLCFVLLICLSLSSCVLSTQWSDNFALSTHGTEATDPLLNDGDLNTIATAWMKDQKRVFALKFPTTAPVRKIVIHNKNLFRFDVEYWDSEAWEWKQAHAVRQRRNIKNERAQQTYTIDQLNFETNMIRIMVSRTVDDKVISKMTVSPEDKIVNQIRDNVAGRYVEYYRVLAPAEATIREIEVYHFAEDTEQDAVAQ